MKKGILRPREDGYVYTCPCCGYPSLDERGGFDICSICFWEDDGQDSHNADIVLGGPNGDYSLREARENFAEYYTCYRAMDACAFEASSARREWAKQISPRLSQFRWEGRAKLPADLDQLLRLGPKK